MNHNKNLFEKFSPIRKEEWVQKLEKDLKGRPYEELHWTIGKDILIEPFYHADDEIKSYQIPFDKPTNDWEIGETILLKEPKSTNKILLNALQNGVNAPRLQFDKAPNADEWAAILAGVNLNYISTHLYCTNDSEIFNAIANLMEYMNAESQYDLATLKGSIHTPHFNSIDLNDFVKTIGVPLPNFKIFTVNAIPFYQGKDQVVEELYQTIKEGNRLLDHFFDSQFSLETIASKIQFSIAVGTSYFLSIAKIRALHLLWANVLNAYQLKSPAIIDAHFAKESQVDNVDTNKISATTQAMSAVIGGLSRLTVLPADANQEATSDFSKRIASNVQHLLKMESHLDVVQDPAAGSYYIEKLTEQLAIKAWARFQKG